jgi:magnesium chelatase subunit I
MENLVSNAERRAIVTQDANIVPRISDLPHVLPGMTGKVELVFEGEQEGPTKVGKALIGKAVREVFKKYFPDPLQRKPSRSRQAEGHQQAEESVYAKITAWFESGNKIEISDDMPLETYLNELDKVKGLREVTKRHMKIGDDDRYALASAMEFTLDGLHQFSKIAKDEMNHLVEYKDLVGSIFAGRGGEQGDD